MSADKIILTCSLLFALIFYSINAQQKANQKCAQYTAIPATFKHGKTDDSLIRKDEFSHMVALGYGSKNNLTWLCGGALISENYVLTAAHCIDPQGWGQVKMVRMGVKNLNDDGVDSEIAELIKHPDYKPPSFYNDVALIKLKNNVKFSKSILPACLNTAFEINSTTNTITTTLWDILNFNGSPSNELIKIVLTLYPHSQCNTTYNNVSPRRLSQGIIDSTQMCAASIPNEEENPCQVDFAGPLAMKTGPLYTVIGVTSFGIGCGLQYSPVVYTRVSAYVPWIEKNVWP